VTAKKVASPAKPAKPFRPQSLQSQRATHQTQLKNARAALRKAQHFHPQTAHQQQKAHHAAAVKARRAKRAKRRGWSPDEDVALCTARAFAESLRLATGRPVADADVLDVYWATASDADAGASIVATAEAILAGGLGGYFPARVDHVYIDSPDLAAGPLLLGLALPEPHTVTVGPDGGWWSWGEPFDPAEWPGLVVEEAWAVTWRP
jgi:hypothetical protein